MRRVGFGDTQNPSAQTRASNVKRGDTRLVARGGSGPPSGPPVPHASAEDGPNFADLTPGETVLWRKSRAATGAAADPIQASSAAFAAVVFGIAVCAACLTLFGTTLVYAAASGFLLGGAAFAVAVGFLSVRNGDVAADYVLTDRRAVIVTRRDGLEIGRRETELSPHLEIALERGGDVVRFGVDLRPSFVTDGDPEARRRGRRTPGRAALRFVGLGPDGPEVATLAQTAAAGRPTPPDQA